MATAGAGLDRKTRNREAVRKYRLKYPERAKRCTDDWCARNADRLRKYRSDYRSKDLARGYLVVVKYRAKCAGMQFDLDNEWFWERYAMGSALSGIEFQNGSRSDHNGFSASIDRIDPTRGYTKDNCRLILQAENMFKGRLTDDEMLSIALAILERANECN